MREDRLKGLTRAKKGGAGKREPNTQRSSTKTAWASKFQ